tara:strand:+ start:6934 stop:7554 length:621 start_codon:yes stop_codon:yes gene_type:complete
MVVNLTQKNNLENLLEIIHPSKSIHTTFNSVQEKFDYIADLKEKESKVIKQFLKLSKTDILLDYGVGLGFITEHLHEFVSKTYCYDTDHRMLDYCKEKFGIKNNVEYTTDLENIQPNKITINHVFAEHYTFTQFTECLQTLYNILANKGLVWLDFFNLEQKNHLNGHLNKNFYSLKKTIFTLQQIGFKEKLVDSRNVHVKMVVEKL